MSSAESFRKNIPSIFTIETIEPSVICILHKKDYERIMKELSNDTAFLKEMTEIIFERQLYYVREFLSFIRDTPQQRYLNLLQQKPHILQRIPQHYIASYLGITPVHLSRIRNKLLKENKKKKFCFLTNVIAKLLTAAQLCRKEIYESSSYQRFWRSTKMYRFSGAR